MYEAPFWSKVQDNYSRWQSLLSWIFDYYSGWIYSKSFRVIGIVIQDSSQKSRIITLNASRIVTLNFWSRVITLNKICTLPQMDFTLNVISCKSHNIFHIFYSNSFWKKKKTENLMNSKKNLSPHGIVKSFWIKNWISDK